jgi:hypothetical protein
VKGVKVRGEKVRSEIGQPGVGSEVWT